MPFFVHGFVLDKEKKMYKIFMVYGPRSQDYYYNDHLEQSLVTEMYDSTIGMWTHRAEYTFQVYLGYRSYYIHTGLNKSALLCMVWSTTVVPSMD